MQPSAELCRIALDLAREAHDHNEIPVGSVLYRLKGREVLKPRAAMEGMEPGAAAANGRDESAAEPFEILASARNRVDEGTNATLHAELQAISMACELIGSERLPGCFLVTTLEPCMMCTGALVLARIEAVYFFTPVLTGVGMTELLAHSSDSRRFNHYPRVEQVEEYQAGSAELLRSFFQKKRELHKARKLEEPLAAQTREN